MIRYLKFENQELPIRISYYALKRLKLDLGRSFSTDDDGTDYEVYETLLYYALKKGYEKTDKEFPFSKDDMEKIMDEVYFDFLRLIPEFFEDMSISAEELKVKGGDVEQAKKLNP